MAKSAVLQTKLERTRHFPDYIKLRPEVLIRLNDLFEFQPPDDLRNHLIEMYHLYILHEHESLPYNFSHMADGMILLLDFLKFADEEIRRDETEETKDE